MILSDTIRKAEKSKVFKAWAKGNPGFYLAHAFTMLDEKEKTYRWELGYYNPKTDKLTVIETDPIIKVRPEEEVFKKDGTVSPLVMSKVKISVAKAMDICDGLLKEKYSAQTVTKRIILLQNLEEQRYNVTMVTMAFGLLNIRIDATTGAIASHNLQSIMGLGDWQKGGKGSDKN